MSDLQPPFPPSEDEAIVTPTRVAAAIRALCVGPAVAEAMAEQMGLQGETLAWFLQASGADDNR